MAFYSVSLDEEGNEIETSRSTYRKLYLGTPRKVVKIAPSSGAEEKLLNNVNNTANNYKTVKYVNSATFIEKDVNITRRKLSTGKYEYQNDKESDSNSSCSCNSDEETDHRYQTRIPPEAIPLLELNSDENYSSSNAMTYSYRKVCEVTKMIQKPDAYREWLDAKRTAKNYEVKIKQEKEREAQKRSQQRRALAQQKYKEWVARKKQQIKHEQQTKGTKKDNSDPKKGKAEPNNNEDEQFAKQKVFQAWLKKKLKQEKEFKEKINEELELQSRLEQIRQQKAEEIYKNWAQTAVYKPKPVPLNRGLFTLKGSISSLYINPVSWVFLDTKESSVNL